MTVETEMMNEENGRLRRHIKTLEVELRKQDAAQAQAAIQYDDLKQDIQVMQRTVDAARDAMRLALEALSNSVDLVWEEYTEAERNYGNYPTRRAKLDGMKAMAQQHTDAIAALEKEIGE